MLLADWTDLIPAADLNALKKNTNAQNAMMNAAPGAPRVFQEDLVGCNPSAKPPCPVQNKPIPFTTQTDSSGVPVVTIPFALAPLADGKRTLCRKGNTKKPKMLFKILFILEFLYLHISGQCRVRPVAHFVWRCVQ